MSAYPGKLPLPQSEPRISVVVPVFNGGWGLEQCLAAVAASSCPPHEIIVVDDGSTDGMVRAVAARHGARVLRLDRRRGPAYARNRGAEAARGDVLFFTDADVLLHEDALAAAAETLADDSVSAVFGSYDDEPGHESFLSQYRNLYHHWVHQTGNRRASTFWSGCGAIRRDVFLELGGFSECYGRPSVEDIELGARLRRRGHRIRLEKTMLGKHMKRWKFWNLLKTDIFRRGVPWMELVLREGRLPSDLNLKPRSRAAAVIAGLFAIALVAFPLVGHGAAIVPACALLLTGAVIAGFSGRSTRRRRGTTLLAAALALSAPVAAFALAPDPWAEVPLNLLLVLVWTQQAFYRYIALRRGDAFALAAVPMQLLFFLGCAAAVVLAFIRHHRRARMEFS